MNQQIDRQVEREELALEESLNRGEISQNEYNQSLREMYRAAREAERETRDQYNPNER
jgi:hypothetical protein